MSDDDPTVRVLVEIPKGSRNKYEYNQETGELELDRRLFAAASYPTEYGFVKETIAADGDELDAMVAATEPTFPGCVVPARPIALLKIRTRDGPEPKVLCVPLSDPAWETLEGVDDLPGDLAKEIEHFFESFSELEGKDWRVEGWGTREEALAEIRKARERYGSRDSRSPT
jgi:inorganic pyrophosphatase